ncbi:MAG TPA: PD-(D/E)XK nuclease family protein [Enhygromyxa sp.]|nr:PD-(D/E)XK nuclease family protein [Enhygromyxa sp.]
MIGRDDVIGRLGALIERHSPRRVLVIVRHAVSARWLASLLAERGVTVGARIVDLEGLLRGAAVELAGEPLPPLQMLALVRQALVGDPYGRYAAIAEQPSYQREVLRCFVELERGIEGDPVALDSLLASAEAGSRDAAMIEAFIRFRGSIGVEDWWPGQSLALVLAGHRRVSFLRRRAAVVALGFPEPTLARWERRLLEALEAERWDESVAVGSERQPLDLRLSCAGPEAEIAAVARLLRAEPEMASVVLAPAEAIPRWAARLRHRDVPVRAWVDRRATDTATARTVRALLRIIVAPEQVRRDDLEATLFGPALRAWAATAEQLELDYPRDPSPGDLRDAWDQQRASSFALAALAERVRKTAQRRVEAVEERARRLAWADELLDRRRIRVERAHALLGATIDKLAALARAWEPASLRTLLDDWDLLGRAAVHGVESAPMSAARVIIELLGKSGSTVMPEELAADLDHALATAGVGSWEQTRSIGGGSPVWLLPYASAAELGRLPARVILTGLDRHPSPPVHHGPVSESLRASLGLVPDAARFTFELRELDAVTARSGSVVGSWRHRDGAGNRRPPGPWIAGRQDDGPEQLVGVDVIALPPSEAVGVRPTSPLELALLDWRSDPPLRRRIEAICSHDAPEVGAHTGELGVAVLADRPYSASALQSYAALPYRYFVERVIGLRERERAAESASGLLATEQGSVVHRAFETALSNRLAQVEGPLELATIAEPLLAELLDALAAGYRSRAEHGQAEAIWANERDRWATELRAWWQHWRTRLVEAWGPNPSRRKPEPEVLIPSPFLLAAEWSPAGEQPLELDLGVRTIPFVAAVDRIEIDPLRQRLNVCDYKTGRPSWPSAIAAQLRAGVHLQLPLYALAVQQVVNAAPERLRLSGPLPVGSLRLEYLQRPLPSGSGRPSTPQTRGFAPDSPLGVDASGQIWTVGQTAAGFTLAFVTAIEAGRFPVVARTPQSRGRGRSDRLHELLRVVPDADERNTELPAALRPLPDPRAAREVVQ